MRKIISVFLATILFTSLVLVPAQAVKPYTVGDLNKDGLINSVDANYFNRLLSGMFEVADSRCADVFKDSGINTTDLNYLKRYLIGNYNIAQPEDGVSISDYTVVYPADATVYEQYAAEILVDTVKDKFNVQLNVVTDAHSEAAYEILIGNTNREKSSLGIEFQNNQYICKNADDDIVINGRDYMIGGGVAELCYDYIDSGVVMTTAVSTENAAKNYVPAPADSVILMIGDGMGPNHLKYTDYANKRGQLEGYNYEGFVASNFPNVGTAATYSISEANDDGTFTAITTDSAASATALATGWKTQNEKVGINGFHDKVQNVRELAHSLGLKTGVMSTEPLTGATPSGFTIHVPDRYDKEGITKMQQALLDNGEIDYLKGGVYDNLLSETKKALDIISTDSDGFFIMIEEAYIDKASHDSKHEEYSSLDIAKFVVRYNTAIQYAATFAAARPGTVLIVTADHETGRLTGGGYITNDGLHTSLDVPVYAMGAGTEIFHGVTTDNIDIGKFMAKVFGAEDFGGDFGDLIIHR